MEIVPLAVFLIIMILPCLKAQWHRAANNHYYKFYFREKLRFPDAMAMCKLQQSRLAVLESEYDEESFYDLVKSNGLKGVDMWLGGKTDPRGRWYWVVDGEVVPVTNKAWAQQLPWVYRNNCMMTVYNETAIRYGYMCKTEQHYVCERAEY